MGKGPFQNIILTGFSFTGKSEVGRLVAQRLGWCFADADQEIVALAGKDIPAIFARDGEGMFRDLERQVVSRLCGGQGYVIATGGGAVIDPDNRRLMSGSGLLVCLDARPETIYQRLLAAQEAYHAVRPLLAVDGPLEHIKSLKASRQRYYDMADRTVRTDDLTVSQVVERVVYAFKQATARARDAAYFQGASFVVTTPTADYPVFVGAGELGRLGQRMSQTGLTKQANLVSDEDVFPHYGSGVKDSLRQAVFSADAFVVPSGETSKTLDSAIRTYDWLVDRRTERGHCVVALGGGMVGDLAGFVAATFVRGLPLVHVPTSLIAMADSSIGGKVAVNHYQAKNVIGAFYQPHLVVIDPTTLGTLPNRELISGWAEIIKHAMVLDPPLLEFVESNVARLLHLEAEATTEAIRQSGSLKAMVVSEDERESGWRMVLNYGHTIAHGLEAATGYERWLHGEAVAVGMMGAAILSERLGLLSRRVVERQRELLRSFGLPTVCPGADVQAMKRAMALDKKVREKRLRWVLLQGVGEPVLQNDVPLEDVAGVLEELAAD
ncbi:MAG: 3-dehydroquinate synthase [Chloroflexota bacterium]